MLSRCPACATVFRVDTVQLRAREGRVRCGRCHTVFDAVDAMVDVPLPKSGDTPAPAAADLAPPPAATDIENAAPVADEPEHSHATLTFAAEPDIELLADDPAAVTTERLDLDVGSADAPPSPQPGDSMEALVERTTDYWQTRADDTAPAEAAEAAAENEAPVDDHPGVIAAGEAAPEPDPDVTQPLDIVELEAAPAPDDDIVAAPATSARDPLLDPPPALEPVRDPAVQRIRRELYGEDQTPRRGALKTTLWSAGILLLLLLAAAQLAYLFRTELVIAQPALKPLFEQICARLGCTLPAPRRADLISIESSELNPDSERAPLLRLNALLRNGATHAQDWPHLELSLTDTSDRPIVRRVLAPADYLPADRQGSEFAAASEQAVSVLVDPTDTNAGGYRLYVFYP
ncbi:MAG: DUF3426 domain-containing protein [Methyloversatilis sp.]|uniref:DUF3426 domain-containing protein n=1 Tax=Methyloversatilis sp. TaxID=2569862 RepID=UPI0025DCCCF6|nr:DUF3426 domain-containing protein [Methyloversatilis sp.]MCR6664987.1 DUF3426 domain-containing protein [Methyloversatilis sp.]